MCVFPPLSLQPGLIFWLLSDLLLSDLQIHRVSETMWTWKVSKGPKTMSSRYLQKLVCHPTYRAHIWRRVVLHSPPASLAWRTNGTGSEEGTWFSLVNEALVNIEMPLGTCLRWQRLVKVPYHQSPHGTPCVARLRFAKRVAELGGQTSLRIPCLLGSILSSEILSSWKRLHPCGGSNTCM